MLYVRSNDLWTFIASFGSCHILSSVQKQDAPVTLTSLGHRPPATSTPWGIYMADGLQWTRLPRLLTVGPRARRGRISAERRGSRSAAET